LGDAGAGVVQMKRLPSNYSRTPIVAWAVAQRRITVNHNITDKRTGLPANYKTGKTMVDTVGVEACPFNDYEGAEVDWDEDVCHVQGMVQPVITIIPAQPNTFKISKEGDGGCMEDFCYEINGVFTDYRFNEYMQEALELF